MTIKDYLEIVLKYTKDTPHVESVVVLVDGGRVSDCAALFDEVLTNIGETFLYRDHSATFLVHGRCVVEFLTATDPWFTLRCNSMSIFDARGLRLW